MSKAAKAAPKVSKAVKVIKAADQQSQIKKLIAFGKEKGYLTYAEVSDHLVDLSDAEQIDDVIVMIQGMGIQVHDEAPDTEQQLFTEPAVVAAEDDEEAAEEAAATLAALDDQFGRTTDPVRMYMREMGAVELLDREGEIRIAKRIEEGLNEAMYAMAQYPETVAILLEAYDQAKEGKKRLAEVVVGFFDPNAPVVPPEAVAAIVEEEAEAAEGDDEDEEKVDTGPDPVLCAENFGELQKLYDKAWQALEKIGSGDKKTEKLRAALADHLMTFRLSPKIVDEITNNLRDKIDQVRAIERGIMRICVHEAGMDKSEFLQRYRDAGPTDLEWIDKAITAKRKYSATLKTKRDDIAKMQEALHTMEGDNLITVDEIKDIYRRMTVGEAKALRKLRHPSRANYLRSFLDE